MASGWNLWVWLPCIGVVSGCCCKEVYRPLLKPGTGRDSAGISRPVPATKTRDETSVRDTETWDPGRDIDLVLII